MEPTASLLILIHNCSGKPIAGSTGVAWTMSLAVMLIMLELHILARSVGRPKV